MYRILVITVACLAVLLGCAEETLPPRTIEVVVDEVVLEPYQPKSRYVGRLIAQDDVALQARVTGYLKSREVREGDLVAAGDVLDTIDDSE